MTVKQLEERISKLEKQVADLRAAQPPKKEGWRALVGIATDDPVMKDVLDYAREYREKDRRKARRKPKSRVLKK